MTRKLYVVANRDDKTPPREKVRLFQCVQFRARFRSGCNLGNVRQTIDKLGRKESLRQTHRDGGGWRHTALVVTFPGI